MVARDCTVGIVWVVDRGIFLSLRTQCRCGAFIVPDAGKLSKEGPPRVGHITPGCGVIQWPMLYNIPKLTIITTLGI